MLQFRILLPIFCGLVLLSSCKKKSTVEGQLSDIVSPVNDSTAIALRNSKVVFDFKAFAGSKALSASGIYNNNGVSFDLRIFNYYISNIKFKRSDGYVYSEPESYHLNKHLEGKETFTVSNLPSGTYTRIEFIIGVDSARNVGGIQGGDLAVEQGMFWEWNTGYIFFKMEGSFAPPSGGEWENFGMHVGGFTGKNNSLQSCSFTLKSPIVAKYGNNCGVFYHVNVLEAFKTPTQLDFQGINDGGSQVLKTVSENYADMFTIDRIAN